MDGSNGEKMNAARLTRRWQIAALRGELRSEITAVRGEITGVRGDLRTEIASVRDESGRVVLTVFGAQVVLIGIMVTILFQILR